MSAKSGGQFTYLLIKLSLNLLLSLKSNSKEYLIRESSTAKIVYGGRVDYWLGTLGVEFVLDKEEILSILENATPEAVRAARLKDTKLEFKAKFTNYKKTSSTFICDETSWHNEIVN